MKKYSKMLQASSASSIHSVMFAQSMEILSLISKYFGSSLSEASKSIHEYIIKA